MTSTARELIDIAYADPERALELGDSYLSEHDGEHVDRARVHRALSIAHQLLGDFGEAVRMGEMARDAAISEGDDEEQLLAVLTMTGPLTVVRTTGEALELIDSSNHLATTPYLTARVAYQRGVVWMRMGEEARAREAFRKAVPGLRDHGDALTLRAALQNLGVLGIVAGDLDDAERHLREALAIAVERNEEPSISGIQQSLGRLAAYRGDITDALALLVDSDEIYMRLTGSGAPQHVVRCEVLLSAGLFREAYQLACDIAESNRAVGEPEHRADALAVAARAALLAGDAEAALATVREAAGVDESLERPVHAIETGPIEIEARLQIEGASQDLLNRATGDAVTLESENQMVAAAQARLLVGRIAIDLGDADEAAKSLEPVSTVESGPIELQIQGRLARARLRYLQGNTRGADAAARSGLRLIDDYQAVLGATDLRMGLEQHGAELGEIGLELALASGDPRRILRWMDRTRARALRHRPVISDADEHIRRDLSRLRQVEAELRDPANRGNADLLRERRRLQEKVRTADRLKRARSESDADPGIDTIIETLHGGALLEIAIQRGHLIGVLVQDGRARQVDLGPADSALKELSHLRFEMRRAARRGRPIGRESLAALDQMLLSELRLDCDELVVIPPASLMAAPWAALPSLRERVLTIAPSAEMWWRASRRKYGGREYGGGAVVVAGGPDLAAAVWEVDSIGKLYDDAAIFPPGSGVEEVGAALEGASLAHIASHATFQVENPMFSSLRLGDGDLNVYDVERLEAPPASVVLSACDSGYTETRSGDELAGLTSALLSMGTRSIVASVGLVPDTPATSDLMVGFHEGLIEGLSPGHALSRAQVEAFDDPASFIAAASFVCVGA